jgi:hypothetical protein
MLDSGMVPAALPIDMKLLSALLLCAALASRDSAVDEAKRRAESGDLPGAVELIYEHLARKGDDAPAHELAGRWLLDLGRLDEAAHQLAASIGLYESTGREREASRLTGILAKADRYAARRTALEDSMCKDLLRAAEKLADSDQGARAEATLLRIENLARGKDRQRIETLLAEMRAAKKEVDLDEAADDEAAGAERKLLDLESAHYELSANLEPDVVQLVADTMDDIYRSYVQIYFDGESKKANLPKAGIRIHPTWDSMIKEYGGTASPGLGGWWSPGENRVVCYDTRENSGSLDQMLDTLFHEASHQFMTMLAGGSNVPAWLNEGTSCFFEGAVAMADHRVLWPDAALERLQALSIMLESTSGSPKLADVIGYESPGSYQGEYYPFGWGLVYFLQQWEDPSTLEYAYRPLYARYRDLVIQKGGSRKRFDEVFLGKSSPLGHQTFEDFERDWKRWILETVRPLHLGTEETIRQRRWDEAQRYLAAAEAARAERHPKISEQELLERALGHVEMLRRRGAPRGDPGRDLLLAQIDVLKRLDRTRAEAMAIEQLLDLADAEELVLDPEKYASLETRLSKLDSGNWALRGERSKESAIEKRVLALLSDYQKEGETLLLRSATFAAETSAALASEGQLAELAASLRARAREKGLLRGTVTVVRGASDKWAALFAAPPTSFHVTEGRIEISSTSPSALLDPSVPVRGEYEVRARLVRGTERRMGSSWGWIVGGTPEAGAMAVGIDEEGRVAVWEIRRRSGAARPKRVATLTLDRALADDEDPLLAVRVSPTDELEIVVGDRPPVRSRFTLDLPPERWLGVFVRDATLVLEDPVVEILP